MKATLCFISKLFHLQNVFTYKDSKLSIGLIFFIRNLKLPSEGVEHNNIMYLRSYFIMHWYYLDLFHLYFVKPTILHLTVCIKYDTTQTSFPTYSSKVLCLFDDTPKL